MRMLKGGSKYLPALFLDAQGDPVEGLTLADVFFDINFTDNTAPSDGNIATHELDDGVYSYIFTDTLGKEFWYVGRTAGYRNFYGGFVEVVDAETVKDVDYSHANNVNEQTVFEETLSDIYELKSILLDFNALTKDITVKVYVKVDDTNYRAATYEWNYGMNALMQVGDICVGTHVKIVLQSPVAEGAARTVPYRYVKKYIV